MKTAIDTLLDRVDWKPVPAPTDNPEDLPYPTHSGKLDVGGIILECHVLNDGTRIFAGEAIEEFFAGLRDGV